MAESHRSSSRVNTPPKNHLKILKSKPSTFWLLYQCVGILNLPTPPKKHCGIPIHIIMLSKCLMVESPCVFTPEIVYRCFIGCTHEVMAV